MLQSMGWTTKGPESKLALRSTKLPIQWVLGFFSLGVKQPGREVDQAPPTSAKVKKMWVYTSTPHTPLWRSAYLSTGTTLPLPLSYICCSI
jgi:hypothetical protein